MSAARRTAYLPPKQKPATPILREFVGKGGGEERRAWKKVKTRGLVTERRFLIKNGMAIMRTRTMRRGLVKIVVNQEPGFMIFSVRAIAEMSIALPVGEEC